MTPGCNVSVIFTLRLAFPFVDDKDIVPLEEPFHVTLINDIGPPDWQALPAAGTPPEIQIFITVAESQFPIILYWYKVPRVTHAGPEMVTCPIADCKVISVTTNRQQNIFCIF